MIHPFEIDFWMTADRTGEGLSLQTDGLWLDTSDKEKHPLYSIFKHNDILPSCQFFAQQFLLSRTISIM